ncbi:MAG TPA: lytic transglycosylase domain-containing protein [Spirochaetota bacterium]
MIEDVFKVMDRIAEIRGRFGLDKTSDTQAVTIQNKDKSFSDTLDDSVKTLEGAVEPANARKHYRTHMNVDEINALAERISAKEGISSSLVKSIIKNESNYDADAVSPKGAMGLMQLMPSAVEDYGVADPFSPEENITGGTRMLKKLITTYQGDYRRAIAAYNAGKATVDRSGGDIPAIPETRDYVKKVFDTKDAIDAIQNNGSEE